MAKVIWWQRENQNQEKLSKGLTTNPGGETNPLSTIIEWNFTTDFTLILLLPPIDLLSWPHVASNPWTLLSVDFAECECPSPDFGNPLEIHSRNLVVYWMQQLKLDHWIFWILHFELWLMLWESLEISNLRCTKHVSPKV